MSFMHVIIILTKFLLVEEDMERAIIGDLVSHIFTFSDHLHKAANFAAELDW